MYFMTGKIDPVRREKMINQVRGKQNPDGSWSCYFSGPGDLNVGIQVYFALKLSGVSGDEPEMKKAKDWIVSHGGIMRANTITKIYLAMFGQFDYRGTPAIPPEIMLLPNWAYLNIYEFASWSRETIIALILVLSCKPLCKVPPSASVAELYAEPENKRDYKPAKWGGFLTCRNFFLCLDYLFKLYDKFPVHPFRKSALKKVENWIVSHQELDGSWGGIMLPWIYALMVLKYIGYNDDHPVIKKGIDGLKPFVREDEHTLRLEPSTSPVWDTAWTILALIESGLKADNPALQKSVKWLLSQEIKADGDWKVKNPDTPSGCWSFEFNNDFYPDMDDTAVVPRAILSVSLGKNDEESRNAAAKRGIAWVKAMQSRDGGWAAFDRDNDRQILASVPYADFMTPLDPTCSDVTAHAVDLLGRTEPDSAAMKKAVAYLKKTQKPDGSWYGRWGVNYVYGTGLTLCSLKSAGEKLDQDYIQHAASWLESIQHEDGGWGETCATYDNPANKGKGPRYCFSDRLGSHGPDRCR